MIWKFENNNISIFKYFDLQDSILSMIFIEKNQHLIFGLKNGKLIAYNSNFIKAEIQSFNNQPIIGLELNTKTNNLICISLFGDIKE